MKLCWPTLFFIRSFIRSFELSFGLIRFFRPILSFGLIFVCSMVFLSTQAQAKTIRIGIAFDGNSPRFPGSIDLVKEEILHVTQGEHQVIFPESQQLSGEYDINQIKQNLDTLLSSKQIDLVLTLGGVTTNEVCQRPNLLKPVIAANVIDAQTQNLPSRKGTSGVNNLNYINTFSDFNRAFQAFLDIAPFSRVVFLADGLQVRSIPQLKALKQKLANEFSLDITVVQVETTVQQALEQIPENTDAVFVSLLPRLSENEFQKLIHGLMIKKLPSFSFRGREDVEKGLLTSIISEDGKEHMARSIAVNVQEFLDGNKAENLQTTFPQGEKLSINMATARAIGVYPGWGILTEAELINEEDTSVTRKLNIYQAIAEARQANPDLAVADQQVQAGLQRVQQAKSALLPQVGIGSQARVIDDDRAAASLGAQPENMWSGSVSASQLVYSDKVWANYSIEQLGQTAREQGRNAVELDVVQAASIAYLDVLKAKRIERIQKENLKLTRKNLERAQIRVSIGAAGPEEVYRWESQLAESRRQVLIAESVSLNTISTVNRVLNRPLSEMFSVEENDFKDPLSILPNRQMLAYMDNPHELNILRKFLVQEGLEISPELQQLEAAISAQERTILLAKREFWLPSVSLFGDVTETFSKGGAGTSAPSLGGINLPTNDDTNWTAGVMLSLPLFSGGGKNATLKRSELELTGLNYQRQATSNSIEKLVLNSVYLIRASYPSIRLTMDAAESANRNLTLVTDSYVRGIKSIIDLIDAQNQSLVADQLASNSIYNFLIDLMRVQRSLGKFFLFAPEEERQAFMERLNQYMETQGIRIKTG